MDGSIFDGIEQDNNPSLYGNQSFAADPYGRKKVPAETPSVNQSADDVNDLVQSSIGLSNKIKQLVNDPNLSIDIVSSERLMNSSIIVYLIELSLDSSLSIIVKRRYSEFKSLRDNLVQLFPTVIVPPIPEKHSLFNYVLKSFDSNKDVTIIDTRKRTFRQFLVDLVFYLDPHLRNCLLLHKFLDPNYELCWNNAINEPPVSWLPNNLLLANPINPTDQNGLYTLLPVVNGFEFNSLGDNLSLLKKINEDLHKLNGQIDLLKLKENSLNLDHEIFNDIPSDLINFEIAFHHNIKVLSDLNKLNSKSIKNFKSLVNSLVELGGNLNNFSLQIHELSSNNNGLSALMERFGLAIDLNFLNFESFVVSNLIPNWQEPIHQLIQYYVTALQIIKFYKFKLIQFKLLYKLKFNKFQELAASTSNLQEHQKLNDLKKLNINSPSINDAIKRIESKRTKRPLSSKKSWYGLFGGNKQSFVLPDDDTFRQYSQMDSSTPNYTSPTSSPQKPVTRPQPEDHYHLRIQQTEKELAKMDQLINVVNNDMIDLTKNLQENFQDFLRHMDRKWVTIMLEFVRSGKQMFSENMNNWNEFKLYLE